MATILVTGGSGYIGSHTVLELLNKNYDVVAVDNFSNSSFESLRRVQKITNKTVTFYEADIRDGDKMESIFAAHKFDAVIHFAAFKAVVGLTSNSIAIVMDAVNNLSDAAIKRLKKVNLLI